MGMVKQMTLNGNIKTNEDLKLTAKRMVAVGYGGGKGTPTVIVTAAADNNDTCEMCGKTAVCTSVTVHVDSEAITDMLICGRCQLVRSMSRMADYQATVDDFLAGTGRM